LTPPLPGSNRNTTLPLHAIAGVGGCEIDDPCDPGPPTVNVPAGEHVMVYLLSRNHDDLAAVQTAFDWGTWTFLYGLWDCQVVQIYGTAPEPPGGPRYGTIATAFNCVLGPSTAVIGRMAFITGDGCLVQVPSIFPHGIHVLDCGGHPQWPIVPERRGSVCVGAGGIDTCEPGATPVERTTWGAIKAQYGGGEGRQERGR
jgi:hypothetical protein